MPDRLEVLAYLTVTQMQDLLTDLARRHPASFAAAVSGLDTGGHSPDWLTSKINQKAGTR